MPEEKVAQQLRPTMLIGIGGSGKEVLLQIRRLFYERMGKNADGSLGYPIIGYLAVDTDPGSPNLTVGGLEDFVLRSIDFQRDGIREFIDCSISDQEFAGYFRGGRNQHPHIFRWLSPSVQQYGAAGAATHGAGQNRQVARLCFFHHYRAQADRPGIRPTLEARLNQILEAARVPAILKQWKPEQAHVAANELDVILIYSLAGGTGAGMFLDMGFLAREVCNKLGIQDLRPFFTHFVILPESFLTTSSRDSNRPQLTEEMKKKIKENAYAALREMEYFSLRAGQTFDLSVPPPVPKDDSAPEASPWYKLRWEVDGEVVSVESAPWDTCFLVGGSNDVLSPGCLSRGEVFQMIAEYIFLDFDPSKFSTSKRSRRSNERSQVLAQAIDAVRDEGGVLYSHYVSRRFSTFGLSQIYFDRARMRRAASCRLAVSLLDHWMRKLELSPTMRRQFASDDLLRGKALAGGRVGPAMNFEAVRTELLLLDRKLSTQLTWLNKVEEDAEKQRESARHPSLDPQGGVAAVEHLLKKNQERLVRTAVGGREGEARESIKANSRAFKEEVERRLRELFLYRCQELGIPETLLLLDDYGQLLQGEVELASEWTQKKFHMNPVWKARLEEACHLPNWPILRPAQKAVREELLRALGEAELYLKREYTREASESIRECLALGLRRCVGEGTGAQANRTGSYADVLLRFQDLQAGTRTYLNQRFGELSKADRASSDRTVGLLANWGADRYDGEIKALLNNPDDPRPYAKQVEARVLAQLREQKSKEGALDWDGVDSIGTLILRLVPLDRSSSVKALVEELARDLMNACWELLRDFCKDRRAIDLFKEDVGEQDYSLSVLKKYGAPFLLRNNEVNAAQGADPVSVTQLGITDSDSESARQFKTKLGVANAEMLDAQEDAIVLCQEKHGIPLYYYQGLKALGQAYYSSNFLPERHIDFSFLKDRLPEVRKIDQEKQKHLANCLELTLQGIMTGILRWDRDQFWLDRTTGSYGMPTPTPQGARLENMVHRYAENEGERLELERQLGIWMKRDGISGDGLKLALLCCATDDLRAEINYRVTYQIQRRGADGQEGGAFAQGTLPVHPLEKILTKDLDRDREKGLVLRLRSRLEALDREKGARWLNSRIDLHYLIRTAEERSPQEQQVLLEERKLLLQPCFMELPPAVRSELPIRVIRHDAALSLEAVQWRAHQADGGPGPRAVVFTPRRLADDEGASANDG